LLLVSAAAYADEPDPSKMTASQHWTQEADSLVKHGSTLIKISKMQAKMARLMKKFPQGAAMSRRMSSGTGSCGRGMVSGGQWLKKFADKVKGSKNDKTFAEFMEWMSKLPEKDRTEIVTLGKEAANEMKEWGQEMIKHADMALGMYEKMGAAAPAPAPEKKEPEKKE
jgi:hypothetical protein